MVNLFINEELVNRPSLSYIALNCRFVCRGVACKLVVSLVIGHTSALILMREPASPTK